MDHTHHPGQPVAVLLPDLPHSPLDYLAPAAGIATGAFVRVPLGKRQAIGVVWGPGSGTLAPDRLRPIDSILDLPPLTPELRRFIDRAAEYTLASPAALLRLATRVPDLGAPPPQRRLIRATGQPPERATPARARVLTALTATNNSGLSLADLCRAARTGPGVVKALIAQGALAEYSAPRDQPYPRLDPTARGHDLAPDQAAAATALRTAVAAGGYGTTLLKGVTGAGKTEVYLEAVAATLAAGRQALVLVPEIALTADFLARVTTRFGAAPGEWHSGIPPAERRRLWHMTAQGGVGLVVGARSALFLPFRDLGLIVVDEEHDQAYKQEEGTVYHARDMAVLRGSIAGAQVVLASATPSLETWANAAAGRYRRLDLPARFGTAELPQMQAIDLRTVEPPAGRWISAPLEQAVTARLAQGEQALLFLNRRGFAPVTICRACGNQIACNDCDARMVEHRFHNRLICHQCGASRPIPTTCPSCGAEGRLAAVGPGVERIAAEAAILWPEAQVRILSSDRFTQAAALKAEIAAIAAGNADLIIGTQIVAKGHNFPLLTLVGVIDADLGLQGSDLRAAERTFQLMRQVAGRAGRAERPGLALLQTHQPDHPVIRAIIAGDEEGFWQAEAAGRQAAGMPPYGRLAALILSAIDLQTAFDYGHALARSDEPLRAIGATVWGPAPAPIARIRGRHRVRLLIQAGRRAPLQTALRHWLAAHPPPRKLRLTVDIDPQSFL